MDQCTAYNNKSITPNTTSYKQFTVARYRQECSFRRHKIMEYLGCLASCYHGMEIHHACNNPELLCKVWLRYCKVSQCQQWQLLTGKLQCHSDWPITLNGFLNVDKSVPTSRDQPAKSGQPRTQLHACERQGRGEDRGNISLTKGSSCEDILMALLALDSAPSLSDPRIIVKARFWV